MRKLQYTIIVIFILLSNSAVICGLNTDWIEDLNSLDAITADNAGLDNIGPPAENADIKALCNKLAERFKR